MSKERLEEIKDHVIWTTEEGILPRIEDSDLQWLIQQAERVRELEDELIEQKECFEELQNNHTRVCNQNKRYREVIKKAIDDLENECLWDALIALVDSFKSIGG